jgi:23S rRNA pseudouridine1911/1915/1917 synthase
LNRLLRKGFVSVDGAAGTIRSRLQPGQRVLLSLPEGAFLVAPNCDVPFRVVYEDEALVVVEKPAGVVSEPGIGHKLDSLLNGLIARYGAALDRLGPACDYGMVHRLDRDTSGLLVVARRSSIQRALREEFHTRRVEKRYLALIIGRPEKAQGRISLPLGRVRRRGRAVATIGGRGARKAVTRYRVLQCYRDVSLIEARPETGRWRQIRLHCAALGHPVAGDVDHGDAAANRMLARDAGLGRLFLHAGRHVFVHPQTGKKAAFASDLPEPLLAVLRRLPVSSHT